MRLLMISLAALMAGGTEAAHADTLGEAMASAVDSNPTLAAQRERLRATREVLPQAWSDALPQISLSGAATSSRQTSGNPLLNDSDRNENWSASVGASQLLFGGGRVLASTRAARAQIRGAVASYDSDVQDLLIAVTTAYADVQQQQAFVQARTTAVSNLSRLFDYAQAQFDAGVVTRTDVAQAQSRLAQARTQLIQSQGGLAAAVQAYLRLIGRPPADLQVPPTATGLPSDLATALDNAGRNSPTLQTAVANSDLADANVAVAAAQGRPTVTLQASRGTGANFNIDNTTADNSSVGVRVTVPIFEGGLIRSRTRQEQALRSAADLDLAAAHRTVQESVTNAWTGLASARSALDTAQQEVTASELAYEGVRLEQETGLRSTVEVLNQEQDLLNAHLTLAQAQHDLVIAERQLLAAEGALTVETGGGAGAAQPNDQLRGR